MRLYCGDFGWEEMQETLDSLSPVFSGLMKSNYETIDEAIMSSVILAMTEFRESISLLVLSVKDVAFIVGSKCHIMKCLHETRRILLKSGKHSFIKKLEYYINWINHASFDSLAPSITAIHCDLKEKFNKKY